jgi:hypothetical protein
MSSLRTQVYLTEEQRRRIEEIRRRDGRSLAAVVRDALDVYLAGAGDVEGALDRSFGSLPGVEVPAREEWDRFGRDWDPPRRG